MSTPEQTAQSAQTDSTILRDVAKMFSHTGWLNADSMAPVRARLLVIADRLEIAQEARGRFTAPPNGWYVFGTHASWSPAPPLEFSPEKDDSGSPLFERPVPIPVPVILPETPAPLPAQPS